jgi:hypothetical protein
MATSGDFENWGDELPAGPELPIPEQETEDGIIAELLIASMTNDSPCPLSEPNVQLAHSPVTAPCTPCAPYDGQHSMVPLSPLKRKAPRSAFNSAPSMKKPALLSSFGSSLAKKEPRLPVEPLTPSPSSRAFYQQSASSRLVSGSISTHQLVAGLPQSPLSESGCSDDEDSMDAPFALPSSPLPMPTKAVATRRRAYRSKALKRSRARHVAKDELSLACSGSGSVGSFVNNTATSTDNDAGEEDPDHPFDKKIARAIRNRQAAQRSRVEAKAKMQQLAIANDELACKVESLRAENEALNKQLRAVIDHSFGQGHDIAEVVSLFERAKSCNIVDQFCN